MPMDEQSPTRDPERTYGDPRHILDSQDLTAAQKLALLESWHADLIELQRAAEENMTSANVSPGTNAAKLAQVTEAIASVRAEIEASEA